MQLKRDTILKWGSFGCLAGIVAMLAAATVVEKLCGSDFAREHIYLSLPMLVLWGVAAHVSLLWLLRQRMYRRPAVFCLHLAFMLILVGAWTTHKSGRQGRLRLREGQTADCFTLTDGTVEALPFAVRLKEFRTEYHEGTFAPSDFVSTVEIDDGGVLAEASISMNNILKYKHFRFYQSGYDPDCRGTVLTVSHDPWGIAVTYTGYLWLLLSMAGFFFDRNSNFRRLLRGGTLLAGCLLLSAGSLAAAPKTLPKEVAERFCDLNVNYNDRIAPLQTLARDFTVKLYGKPSYKGLSAEQVLVGWFFFYDDWKHEPMIKIKGAATARTLGIEGRYARLTDYTDTGGYKLDAALHEAGADWRDVLAANEKFNLVSSLCTGSMLKIFPCFDPAQGCVVWFSPADRPSVDMPFEQWMFIRRSLDLVAEKVAMKDYGAVVELLGKISEYQHREAASALPSAARLKAEKLYNRSNADKPLAMLCLTVGILCFILFCWAAALQRGWMRPLRLPLCMMLAAIFIYLTLQIALRWVVSRHVPLTNGFETMQFMAWCSVLGALAAQRRVPQVLPFGFLLCGFTLLVAMMGESSPKITSLMPVLQSPLLSLHVMVIMASYTLLAFTMLNGAAAIVLHFIRRNADAEMQRLERVSRIMLYPAVFLLAAGIFIGAVWANVSWGRYWGWDPKEVWALITLLVYSAALHTGSLPMFRRPIFFHAFCIAAFLTVLITYFGVNFILGGMHGYA